MSKRFAWFYLFNIEPPLIEETVPLHVEYWKPFKSERYLGGPFEDRSGGLIIFEASSIEEAKGIAMKDPFNIHGLLGDRWIKEWIPV